jgi:multiple sugar transport system permease protein
MKELTKRKIKETAVGYTFILPLIIYFIVFQLLPMIIALVISFTNYSLKHLDDWTFVGMDNYIDLFTNSVRYPRFWSSLKTTFLYILLNVPASIVITLVVSALLNSKIKGEKFFKTIFYIPSVTVGVAIMALWKQMLAPDGMINRLIGTSVDFLNNESTALLVISFMGIWGGLGYNVLIMLSAMKNIDNSLYEAAELDGANAFQQFLYVTVPGVMPTVFFFLITGLIGGFQVGEQMVILYGDSTQNESVYTYVYGLYYQTRRQGNFGIASAMSYFLFVIILIITLIQFRVQNIGKSSSDKPKKQLFKRIFKNKTTEVQG